MNTTPGPARKSAFKQRTKGWLEEGRLEKCCLQTVEVNARARFSYPSYVIVL